MIIISNTTGGERGLMILAPLPPPLRSDAPLHVLRRGPTCTSPRYHSIIMCTNRHETARTTTTIFSSTALEPPLLASPPLKNTIDSFISGSVASGSFFPDFSLHSQQANNIFYY